MSADTNRIFRVVFALIFISLWLIASCAPTSTPTLFRSATRSLPTEILSTTTPLAQLPTPRAKTPTAAISATPTQIPPCTNNLTFVSDLTIPDGTTISPGTNIDKQWLVDNSGTCNWDSHYRLKWIGGDSLGAVTEQALYPARAGTQVNLRIIFTAPTQPGIYQSAWQAYDPEGVVFGDPIYLDIVVAQ
jgi:Ig-like domain from next to BRCA1 gene